MLLFDLMSSIGLDPLLTTITPLGTTSDGGGNDGLHAGQISEALNGHPWCHGGLPIQPFISIDIGAIPRQSFVIDPTIEISTSISTFRYVLTAIIRSDNDYFICDTIRQSSLWVRNGWLRFSKDHIANIELKVSSYNYFLCP